MKENLINERALDAVVANATRTSRLFDIRGLDGFSVQVLGVTVGGTVSILVQASNVSTASASTDSDWATLSTISVGTGSTTTINNFADANYAFLRIRLTQTGGSGTVTAIVNGK